MDIVPIVSGILNILTLLTDIAIAAWFVLWIMSRTEPVRTIRNRVLRTVAPHARILAFVIALTATLGSLFYSEIARFTPCLLCWYQRIFMYPQVVILGMSIVMNDKKGLVYSFALSAIGAVIAAYHYYLQVGGVAILPCDAVGYSAACSERFTTAYGYITIPMMALTAFAAILILTRMYIARPSTPS